MPTRVTSAGAWGVSASGIVREVGSTNDTAGSSGWCSTPSKFVEPAGLVVDAAEPALA
jgi:hypothetical protein